jgi:hypothetical protein
MVGDLLRHFQLAAVLQIRRDASRTEGRIADPRFDAGRFRAPADDAVSVLLKEGIGGQMAGLAASAAEEIAVDDPLLEARVVTPKAAKSMGESVRPARSFPA